MKQIKTTPKGIAIFPHLRKPETFEGAEIGYTVKLALEPEEMDKFKDVLYKELEKASSLPQFAGKSFTGANLPIGETQDGQEFIKFKSKASGISKTGQQWHRSIAIFDAKGNPLPLSVDVGYGSVIKVAYSVNPYWKNRNMRGLSLMIEGVQVIELAAKGEKTASYCGFGVEEGYECKAEDSSSDAMDMFEDDDADF